MLMVAQHAQKTGERRTTTMAALKRRRKAAGTGLGSRAADAAAAAEATSKVACAACVWSAQMLSCRKAVRVLCVLMSASAVQPRLPLCKF
jgi:hypothetical protein